MKTSYVKLKYKIETPLDILSKWLYKRIFSNDKAIQIMCIKHYSKIRKKYFKNGIWNFNGIKLPEYRINETNCLMYRIYLDTLFIYCNYNDNYDSNLIDKIDTYLPEGPYGYKKNDFDVSVQKDDIVIDAGAWIGDFSAYSSIKGAHVYAFEPCKETFKYLEITQNLNQNIKIYNEGLGDKNGLFHLSNNEIDSATNKIDNNQHSEIIEIRTLDSFVKDINIKKIDFIKADIEGYERNLLIGAKEVLSKFSPKLSICTYHLPDDPIVLPRIILDANPNYRIIQKSKKLYACVNK